MQHFVTSKRPYFIRAMHDWITDNKYTPYILIDASVSGVIVPNEYIQDGKNYSQYQLSVSQRI